MRNCLQLLCCEDLDFVTEFERNRIALQAARSLLQKNNDDKDTLMIARALLQNQTDDSQPSSTDFEASYGVNNLVNKIGGARAINPGAIRPRDYKCGITLFIGCVISTLGEHLLGFISRFVGRLENRRE